MERGGNYESPGENLTPDLKPSIEFALHLGIYKKNSNVSAIVHAHPVFATSFTATKCKIDTDLQPRQELYAVFPDLYPMH